MLARSGQLKNQSKHEAAYSRQQHLAEEGREADEHAGADHCWAEGAFADCRDTTAPVSKFASQALKSAGRQGEKSSSAGAHCSHGLGLRCGPAYRARVSQLLRPVPAEQQPCSAHLQVCQGALLGHGCL